MEYVNWYNLFLPEVNLINPHQKSMFIKAIIRFNKPEHFLSPRILQPPTCQLLPLTWPTAAV